MRSIVLPWYPGGHVLSKMQGRHLYLQDRHWEGSQKKKKKHKAKNHEDCNPIKECRKKTGTEGETQELKKKKKNSPPMPPPAPWLKDRNASPHNLRVFDKTHKKKGQTYQSPRQRRERSQKGKKIGQPGPNDTPKRPQDKHSKTRSPPMQKRIAIIEYLTLLQQHQHKKTAVWNAANNILNVSKYIVYRTDVLYRAYRNALRYLIFTPKTGVHKNAI